MKRIYTILALAILLAMGIGETHAQVVDVCVGNDSVELQLGNYQYGYVQWQVSEDNETWSDIDGAINTVYRFLPERPQYYRAEVRFPACMENNYYSQVSYVQMPPKAFAGPDMSIPAGTVARLCASSFKGAEGEWHIIEGENGLIEDASNPKSGFIGGEGEYKLTWTVTNSCGSNTDTVTVRCVRMEYQPNLVYVDETDAILSDSTQIVNGEYVIVFSDPVPDILVGSVLLGYREPSFLRKVVSFEREGDLYVMQTEQGLLTDVILSGALFIDPYSIAGNGGKKDMVKYIDHYPTRKEMSDNPFLLRDGKIYILNNSAIGNGGGKSDDWEVTAEWNHDEHSLELGIMLNFGIWNNNLDGLIYEETVSLDPNLRANIDYDDGVLNECRLGLYDAVFEHTVSLSIDKELSVSSLEAKGTINKSPILVGAALIGGVPVTLSLDFPASCSLSAAINGLTVSFTSSTTFTNAIEYDPETHEFIKVHDKQPSVDEPGEFDLNGTIDFKLNAGVKLSLLIAGVLGPYVEWSGRVNPSICTSLTPPYYVNADLNYGLDMDLGIRFHLFKDLLETDISRNFKLIDRTEHAPSSVNKYLGDNQVYTFGSFLPTPITVEVEGWFGSKLPLAKIYFEPETGAEVTNLVVSTDIYGKASTLWRPNNPFGRDKLRVKAYDCHGDLIGGTPVVFHAYSSATDPCINSNLTVEAYHVQEDRIIPQVHGGESPFLYSTDGESFSSTVPNIQTQPGHNYTFYVQDKNGCEAMTTYNEPFYDCENSGLTLSVTASGNVINATAYFGFEPYWYSIDGINYQPTGIFTPLLDGEYTIYVRDAMGCVDTKHITVLREGNLYVWISEIEGYSGSAEVRTSTSSLADRGICWSTHHAPTVEDLRVSFGNNTGPFPFTINGLDSETTYYVRAYALDLSGTSYSEERCINPGYGAYLPEVVATGITSVTQTSAVGSGNVTWDGGTEVTERGICWGTNHDPDISGNHIPCGLGIGAYTAEITDLTPNTQYYARAYATNSEGTAYGDEVGFSTLGNSSGGGVYNGHEYVDLGLPSGILWATCNVGANAPEEFGDYFAWGETRPKSGFSWDTYQHCMGGNDQLTKYCNDFNYGYNGFVDDLNVLLPEDDAATANWGIGWHMPTVEEWQELSNNTTNTWTTQNGVMGWLFTASNGNSIFLPAAGDYSEFGLLEVGDRGSYWSSSLYASTKAMEFEIHYHYGSAVDRDYRKSGNSIRPVRSVHEPPQSYVPWNFSSAFVYDINTESVSYVGSFSEWGTFSPLAQGACWSTSPQPTLANSHSEGWFDGLDGDLNGTVSGLAPNTTYHLRVFVADSIQTYYCDDIVFTTLPSIDDTHEYVNLGLPSGTLWATCNVGANVPEEYGDYFAWGETHPKDVYDWNTYQYCNNGDYQQLTKYCSNFNYGYNGFKDMLTVLQPIDDAATANWGGGWCTPSPEQWNELRDNTTHTITTQNGVYGCLFTGSNGTSLFFPFAGYYDNYLHDNGYYWLCSVSNEFYPYNAQGIDLHSLYNYGYRCEGRPVRPVRSIPFSFQLPQVTTSEVSEFYNSSAICGGNVISDGGSTVTERGVCWSTTPNPTINGDHAIAGSGSGSFTVSITGLAEGTAYYVRAYAINSVGTAYGTEVSFTTLFGGVGTHEYVDLGLPSGTLWATCNVGANAPEEYGDYFAWGETQPKDVYNWNTYQYCNGSNTMLTKYCNNPNYGYIGFSDTLTTLLPEDDPASVNWGSDWRTPTATQWEELFNYCGASIMAVTQNGVNGWQVTGPNGNTIFMPNAGICWGNEVYGIGEGNVFWSSSLSTPHPWAASNYQLGSFDFSMYYYGRCNGMSIRPVRSNSGPTSEVPEGAINGLFSVGVDTGPNGYSIRKVYFSQGNLQYIGSAATPYWKFADHQWEYLGDNGQGGEVSDVDRDLFGWGTSGYDHGAVCYQPWSTSSNEFDYYAYGSESFNLYDQTGQADWGYNAIINGENTENKWRTLTSEEWDYIFNNRVTNSGIRFAKANVNSINGLLLLPDDWSLLYYSLNEPNQTEANYSSNIISISQWSDLEEHGVVFLPAAGERNWKWLNDIGYYGNYWSATCHGSLDVVKLYFFENEYYSNISTNVNYPRASGSSVRLVQDAPNGSGSGNGGGGGH